MRPFATPDLVPPCQRLPFAAEPFQQLPVPPVGLRHAGLEAGPLLLPPLDQRRGRRARRGRGVRTGSAAASRRSARWTRRTRRCLPVRSRRGRCHGRRGRRSGRGRGSAWCSRRRRPAPGRSRSLRRLRHRIDDALRRGCRPPEVIARHFSLSFPVVPVLERGLELRGAPALAAGGPIAGSHRNYGSRPTPSGTQTAPESSHLLSVSWRTSVPSARIAKISP